MLTLNECKQREFPHCMTRAKRYTANFHRNSVRILFITRPYSVDDDMRRNAGQLSCFEFFSVELHMTLTFHLQHRRRSKVNQPTASSNTISYSTAAATFAPYLTISKISAIEIGIVKSPLIQWAKVKCKNPNRQIMYDFRCDGNGNV